MQNMKMLGISMVFLQSVIYGLPDSFVKLVYLEFPVFSFLGARYALASIFLLSLWRKTIIKEVNSVNIKHYIVPVICMGSAFLISNTALKFTTVSTAGFIRSSTPIIAAVMLMLFFSRKFTIKDALILAMVMLGMYMLATQSGSSFAQGFGIGEILSLLASSAIAASLVFGKRALDYVSPVTLTCLQGIASLCFCIIGGLAEGTLLTTPWQLFSKNIIWMSMVYLAIPCSVGGILLQNYALKHINPKMISVIQCTYPIVASIVAYYILGERLTVIGLIGCTLVLAAVILECITR